MDQFLESLHGIYSGPERLGQEVSNLANCILNKDALFWKRKPLLVPDDLDLGCYREKDAGQVADDGNIIPVLQFNTKLQYLRKVTEIIDVD